MGVTMVRRLLVALAIVAVAAPAGRGVAGPSAEASKVEFQQLQFQTRSGSTMVYLHVFRFDARSGWYHDPANRGVEGSFSKAYGCMVFAKNSFVDMACTWLPPSSMEMSTDMSRTTINFSALGKYTGNRLTARITATATGETRRDPAANYALPSPAKPAKVEAALLSTRAAEASGLATAGAGGSIYLKRVNVTAVWLSSATVTASN